MNALPLPGCSPTPLAHYLKALGILRLVSEQLPLDLPRPRGAWQGETFVLHSSLDRAALEQFFLHDYRPTPILAPWNGGSGFYAGDKQDGISVLAASAAPRFQDFREGIGSARNALAQLPLTEKPEKAEKDALLQLCRGSFPVHALDWLDAALVLTSDGPKFPPLLGTGGNDGRLEFTNNFMQRLVELFAPTTGHPHPNTITLLSGSLFAEPVRGLTDNAIGQFFPQAAGGANSTSGFDAKSLVNHWDFILMLEGALLFGAAAVKRLESTGPGELAYPFSVRPSGFGYASGSEADTGARCELWAPLWQNPASLAELRQVLGEGRARLTDRAARDGFEFVRAVASLGVDRGLTAFQRYSFAPRNGLAFFATPLDRVPVRRRARLTALLDDLDRSNWLDRVRGAARGDRVPNSVASAVRQLEEAALALLRSGQQEADEQAAVESLLLAVADAEAALARSLTWTKGKGLPPLPKLSGQWWEGLHHTAEPELDLAAGLASLGPPSLRVHWEPLDLERPFLTWDANSREVFWQDAQLEETLLAIHLRRILHAEERASAFAAAYFVQPCSLASFLDGETDDLRLARLARALSLVHLPAGAGLAAGPGGESHESACAKLPALFALPKLALAGRAPVSGEDMPRLAAILRRGAAGDGLAATRLACQRLRGSGFTPALREVPARGRPVRRAVAATLFPLSPAALAALADQFRPLTLSH
ncbi:MAG: type I-U CRISPR-associated protein Csx17 [Verrucomicrobiales bacterium]|nr:type I-U CRISPR-associated protein Csx17 [Verrucomicrobiales bacterium]